MEAGSDAVAVGEGSVFVGAGDGRVYALDAGTGRIKWFFQTGGIIESSPALANGVLYIGSIDHKLYALDAETGEVLWSYETGDRFSPSPAVFDGRSTSVLAMASCTPRLP